MEVRQKDDRGVKNFQQKIKTQHINRFYQYVFWGESGRPEKSRKIEQ